MDQIQIVKSALKDIDKAIKAFKDMLKNEGSLSTSQKNKIKLNILNLTRCKKNLEVLLANLEVVNNTEEILIKRMVKEEALTCEETAEESLMDKILRGAQLLCEENPELVQGIVETKFADEQIAEDFVENFLNKQ